jgi:hypothetical protein
MESKSAATVAWNQEWSREPATEMPPQESTVLDMTGHVVILNTEFPSQLNSMMVVPTGPFLKAMQELGASGLLPEVAIWFLKNAWQEEDAQPDDDPSMYRVSATSHKIWKALDKISLGRCYHVQAFQGADLVLTGSFTG